LPKVLPHILPNSHTLPAPIPPADVTARRKRESDLREGSGFMSTNILKKLVEQFAPETVINRIAGIEAAHAKEQEARFERLSREKDLLEYCEKWPTTSALNKRPAEAIACLS
jgi:hypothetical protein